MSETPALIEACRKWWADLVPLGDPEGISENSAVQRLAAFVEAQSNAEITTLRAQLDEARAKAIEECMSVVTEMREGFRSPEYATGQPLSSVNERIACTMILNNLSALLHGSTK